MRRKHSQVEATSRTPNKLERFREVKKSAVSLCSLPQHKQDHKTHWRSLTHIYRLIPVCVQQKHLLLLPQFKQVVLVTSNSQCIKSFLFTFFRWFNNTLQSINISISPFLFPTLHNSTLPTAAHCLIPSVFQLTYRWPELPFS